MTGKKKNIRSNLTQVDAHSISPGEYDDLPELTDVMLAQAVHMRQGKKLGRPPAKNRKISVHLRVDPEVCAAFRATGPGWQTRMHQVLSDHRPK